jgi:uncharacterized protein (DUF983 family)
MDFLHLVLTLIVKILNSIPITEHLKDVLVSYQILKQLHAVKQGLTVTMLLKVRQKKL